MTGDEAANSLSLVSLCHESDPLVHQAAFLGELTKLEQYMHQRKHREKLNYKNRLGCTPLRLAATAGHVTSVHYLLQCGADVNATDMKAQSPLYVAVKNKHFNCIQVLLAHGAHPDGDPGCMSTPLYCAAFQGYLLGVKELIAHGADIDCSHVTLLGRVGSYSPLQISLTYNHLECFKQLLLAGADPELTRKQQTGTGHVTTSLYPAALKYCNSEQAIGLLYEFGASLYVRNTQGRLPSDVDSAFPHVKTFFLALYERPRSLLLQCRLAIRRILKHHGALSDVRDLPLPTALIKYLNHQET